MSSSRVASRDVCLLTQADPIFLESLVILIDRIVEVSPPAQDKNQPPSSKCVTNDEFESPKYGQPETPTEVENVYF